MSRPDAAGVRWVEPRWPHGHRLRVLTTTRQGGASRAPYDGFNLATHVGDAPSSVAANRRLLSGLLGGLPVQWLEQVHGTEIVEASAGSAHRVPVADGAWTRESGLVLAVLTADCLPVVLADSSFTCFAVVHAGWRGLVGGVLESACRRLPVSPAIAWLGPAIGPRAYEVGEAVRTAVMALPVDTGPALLPGHVGGKWQLDLYALAAALLRRCGVAEIYGEGYCTWTDEVFFSHRRDGGRTGRMATLAWRIP